MSSRNEETVRRLTKLRNSIEVEISKAETPELYQELFEDTRALDHAISVINDPRPRQQPLRDGWQEDGR